MLELKVASGARIHSILGEVVDINVRLFRAIKAQAGAWRNI